MSHPSSAAVDYIRSKATWSQTNAQVLAAIRAITVPNPIATAPQIQVVGTWSWREVRKRISDASLARLQASGVQAEMLASLNADPSAENLAYWMGYLTDPGPEGSTARPIITQAEEGAVAAYIAAACTPTTVADPTWTATLTEFRVLFGREADLDDIAASRPTGD